MREDLSGVGLDRAMLLEIEAVMGQVQNVISVRVVPDADGRIAEVHALTDAGRSPKQIVRDLESVLMSRWGIRIDHKKISIAQIGDEPTAQAENKPRLTISGLEFKSHGLKAQVRVELDNGAGSVVDGQVEGPASTGNRLRLVAQATLAALSGLCGSECQFVLEDVRLETVARKEVVVVCVTTLSKPMVEETLLGTCQVQRDEAEATIRATLDALNRRLDRINRSA